MERVELDHCVVGGGIVGLFMAYELSLTYPESAICLLESSLYLGDESTGRNSGVLHSGIYYPTDSLKHRLCLFGNQYWRKLSEKIDLPVRVCGKYIIATESGELEGLEKTLRQAEKNCVPKVREISTSEREALSEHLHIVDGLFSETTGIINTPEVIKKLEFLCESRGVFIMKGHRVSRIERSSSGFELPFDDFLLCAHYLYNHAGLGAVKLRGQLGLQSLQDRFVKGNYVKTSQRLSHRHLFYPVPPKDLKGLGVHSTLDFDGSVKFGPNTEDVSGVDYNLNPENLERMSLTIHKIFKGVDQSRLYLDYCGIRSKIVQTETKELSKDFWLGTPDEHGIENYYETCGIESPGLTAAPAIARAVIGKSQFLMENYVPQ